MFIFNFQFDQDDENSSKKEWPLMPDNTVADFEVIEEKLDGVFKTGTPFIGVTLEVIHNDTIYRVYENFASLPQCQGIFKSFCKSIGRSDLYKGKQQVIVPDGALVGAKGKAKFKIKDYDGTRSNKVRYFITPKEPAIPVQQNKPLWPKFDENGNPVQDGAVSPGEDVPF